jgi:hypothetical protein
MKYKLVNIDKGELIVDPKTFEIVDDFANARWRSSVYLPQNDVAIQSDHVIIPPEARDLYLDAPDDEIRRNIINVVKYRQDKENQPRSEAFEQWFAQNTIEGINGATAHENEGHYEYAKYYSDIVRDNPEMEAERFMNNQRIPDEYMREEHPYYNKVNTKPNIDQEISMNDDILKMQNIL